MNCRVPSFVRTFYQIGRAIGARISKDSVFAYAGQASYFIVISTIPFMLLLTSLVRFLLPNEVTVITDHIYHILPDFFADSLSSLFEEMNLQADVPILSISGLTLLWASSRGIRSLSEGIRNVYKTRFTLSFFRKYLSSILITVFVMAALIASVALMLFRDYLIDEVLGLTDSVLRLLVGMRFLIFLALLTFLFSCIFYFLSHREIELRHHVTGALFSSLGWNVFSWGYALYVNQIADPTHLYGSLSALVLLLLWLYCCMAILLFGAELNAWLYAMRESSEK